MSLKMKKFLCGVLCGLLVVSAFVVTGCGATQLSPPVLSIVDEQIVWEKVENTSEFEYVLIVNGVEQPAKTIDTYLNDNCKVAMRPATTVGTKTDYILKVKALGKGKYSDSDYVSINYSILATPSNLEMDENAVLFWDDVEGATGYELTFGQPEPFVVNVTDNTHALFDTYPIIVGATITVGTVYVKAVNTEDPSVLSSFAATLENVQIKFSFN